MKLPFQVNLTDKVAVVTGGAGVLGGYWCEALGQCGAKVVILDRDEDKAVAMATALEQKGITAMGLAVNVLSKESLEAAHQKVLEAYGPCDILLNGAGGNHPKGTTTKEYLDFEDIEGRDSDTNTIAGNEAEATAQGDGKSTGNSQGAQTRKDLMTFFDLDEQGIRFVFDLNFLGTLLPCQVFAKDMVGRKGCCIINVSSMNAFTPLTKIPAYSGAKAAISNFTQWLAVHFSKVGIRVNAIAPGFFVTAQNEALLKNPDGSLTPRSEKILRSTPMNRFGEAEELTGALLFLVSEEAASFVNGVILPIDGGFSAYSGV